MRIVPLLVFLFLFNIWAAEVKFNYRPGVNNLDILSNKELKSVLKNLEAVQSFNCSSNGCNVLLKPLLVDFELKGFSTFAEFGLRNLLGLRKYSRYTKKFLLNSGETVSFFLKNYGFLDASVKTELFISNEGIAKLKIIGKEGNLYLWEGFDFENACFSKREFYKKFQKPFGVPFSYFDLYRALELSEELCRKENYLQIFTFYEEPFQVHKRTIWSFLGKNLSYNFPLTLDFLATYLDVVLQNPYRGIKFLLHSTYAVKPKIYIRKAGKVKLIFKGVSFFTKRKLYRTVLSKLRHGFTLNIKSLSEILRELYFDYGFFDIKITAQQKNFNTFVFKIKEGKRYQLKVEVEPFIPNFDKKECEFYSKNCVKQLLKRLQKKLREENFFFERIKVEKKILKKEKIVKVTFKVLGLKKLKLEKEFVIRIKYQPLKEAVEQRLKTYPWDKCALTDCSKDLERFLYNYLKRWKCLGTFVEVSKYNSTATVIYRVKVACKGFKKFGKTVYWIEGKLPKREIEYITLNFEGKKYNPKLFEVLRNRLNRSRLFDSYTVKTVDVSNKTLILIEGTQRKLVSVEGSFGYSSDEGFQLKTGVNFYDLLRMGETVSTSFELSQKRNLYSVSYYDPFFFSKYWYIGGSIFKKYENHKEFNLTQKGLSFTVGRYVGYFSDISLSILGSKYWLENDITKPEGKLLKLSLAFQTIYPIYVGIEKKGLFTGFINFSTAGGNNRFQKLTATVNYSRLILTRWFFHLKTSAGWVSHNAPIFERFYLGGIKNLKGYSYESVAPKGGGEIYWYSTLEGGLKISSNGIYIFGGTDIGNCVRRNQNPFKGIKKDIFLGVGTVTSLGPLRFVVAAPLEGEITLSSLKYLFLLGFTF